MAKFRADTGGAEVEAVSTDEGSTWARRAVPALTACTGGPDGQIVDPSLLVTSRGLRLAS